MVTNKVTIKKTVSIELEINAYSSFGLAGDELKKAVEKDLRSTLESRMETFGGSCGCSNDGMAFGYDFKVASFKVD